MKTDWPPQAGPPQAGSPHGWIRPALAALWLVVVLTSTAHVGLRLLHGVDLRSDLLSMLPEEERDPEVQQAKDAAAAAFGRRVVVLVGQVDPDQARAAAEALQGALQQAGVFKAEAPPDEASLHTLATLYAPHRTSLLTPADRQLLREDRGSDIAQRALGQIVGLPGLVSGTMLAQDPFLLLPAFLQGLPSGPGHLVPDRGHLSAVIDGTTWTLVTGTTTGDPLSLGFQDRFAAAWDGATSQLQDNVSVLRLGALFFAREGATRALTESSTMGSLSFGATVLMLLLAFRSARPLLLSTLSAVTGVVVALAATLALDPSPHVVTLLFGTTLIGTASDHSLHWLAARWRAGPPDPDRLRHLLPGMTLGMLTSVAGYSTLASAPLPAFRPVALFSCVGLFAAWMTVVAWFPVLDHHRTDHMPAGLARLSALLGSLWRDATWSRGRATLGAALLLLAALGAWRWRVDDDMRRQQTLSPTLRAEQAAVERVLGGAPAGAFVLVQAADDEAALQAEEALGLRLAPLVTQGALAGWRSAAQLVPSARQQADDHALLQRSLYGPHLADHLRLLGLPPPEVAETTPLRLHEVASALPALDTLVLGQALHLVQLDGLVDAAAVREATSGLPGVRFVDPTADLSALLARYRERATLLAAASCVVVLPLLSLRYGLRGGLLVLAPPALAAALTPLLRSAAGAPFTFFDAVALVLVMALGVDYSVFCAEDEGDDPAVIAGAALAAAATVLSFGLLATSSVAGVRAFGATLVVGSLVSLLLAPLARRARGPS